MTKLEEGKIWDKRELGLGEGGGGGFRVRENRAAKRYIAVVHVNGMFGVVSREPCGNGGTYRSTEYPHVA